MSNLNLKNLKENSGEILKAEVGALLFNLGKTHMGFWEKHLDIDDVKFEEQYGYKSFSVYKNYFRQLSNCFNNRSPFEIDMDSINSELKDFFYNTDIDLIFKDKKNTVLGKENLKLIDVVKGNAGNNNFIENVMFKGCENVNSGIDKGAPKKQLNNLYIANAFGTTKEEITNKRKDFVDVERYDETRISFFMNLWGKIYLLGKNEIDVYEMRKYILEEIEKWYTHLLSDSRFPANDVTLWDQAYMTASLFKASVAALCLEGEKYNAYMAEPRKIKWSILGVQYDKLGLAKKALNPSFIYWYRKETEEVDATVKKTIEEDFALGNEIYRDETGIYFIVPENISDKKEEDSRDLYNLDESLGEVQEKIVNCFEKFNGEVFPAIFVTKPSRGTMNIAYLLKNANENFLKPVYPKKNFVKDYFDPEDDKSFKVVCDVCKVRLAEKNEDKDLNLCKTCRERESENKRAKLNDAFKETVWIDELQDKNGRLALVTMKFELDEWLNGNMLNTMLTNTAETIDGKDWNKALGDIEKLLIDINKTYIPLIKDEKSNNRKNCLEKYKKFGNNKFKEVKNILSYLDNSFNKEYKKVFNNTFDSKKFNLANKEIIDVFNSYLYSFLENENIELKNIKENEEVRYNFDIFINKCGINQSDWGNSPHTTAKGIFSFSYITEQIKNILLERSIGDEWEKFLISELGNKIDFKNRRIEWDKLVEKDIQFLSKIFIQFVTRKNPSPARFRRIWETTEEFFIDIENNMMDILEIPKWRNIRIKWNKVIKEEKHKITEFEYKGLSFVSDSEGNLYLISSIEKAIPILSKEVINNEEELQEKYQKVLDHEGNWIKEEIELVNKVDESICKVKFKLNKKRSLKIDIISYKPYLSIINPTPISWQFIVPAEYAPKLIEKVQHRYDEEFRYVKGKLPLHIGVVFQGYKKPLYIGIKALRNIRRDIHSWDSIKESVTDIELKQILEKAINNGNSGCENRTEIQRHYSLYPLENSDKGDYNFYIRPEDNLVGLKNVDMVGEKESYVIYPNTIDFEYLDVNTRRNDICYNSNEDNKNIEKAKRVEKYKQNRPYTWEEWQTFWKFYYYFNDEKKNTKLQTMTSLIYSKINDWKDNKSLKHFMLSAFINTFELNDDTSKDDFAQIFGKDKWKQIKDMDAEIFKEELYKFLDMYDFWHNGLKRI